MNSRRFIKTNVNKKAVVYTGTLTHVSDQKFKENIVPIDNALAVVNALNPKMYTYKNDEIYKSLHFDNKEHFGFIAQEIEKVIPQIVTDNVHPAQKDKKGNVIVGEIKYKGVDYIEIIPYVVAAINEQQKIINNQKASIDSLKSQIANCCNNVQQTNNSIGTGNLGSSLGASGNTSGENNTSGNTIATLFQNNPNPFSQQTSIQYFIPTNSQSASVVIFDLNGKLIKTISINNFGIGSVIINGNELNPGMFVYSLVVDGRIIDTKRMILTQ